MLLKKDVQDKGADVAVYACVAREFVGDTHATQHFLCSEAASIIRYYRLNWYLQQSGLQDMLDSVGFIIIIIAIEFDSASACTNDR